MSTTSAVGGVLTAGGALTFALFPFLLPILLVTGVFVAPLLAIGAVIAIALVPVVALAVVVRRLSGRRAERSTPERPARPVHLSRPTSA